MIDWYVILLSFNIYIYKLYIYLPIYLFIQLEEDETLRLKIGLITEEDAWIGDKDTTLSISRKINPPIHLIIALFTYSVLFIDAETFEVDAKTSGQIQVLVYYSARADSIGYETDDGMVCSVLLGVCWFHNVN